MAENRTALVTGGSGYFGEVLIQQLLADGWEVRNLDLNLSPLLPRSSQYIGDIRNIELCENACLGVEALFHNVAQVPLAKNNELFRSVNIDGTEIVLKAAFSQGVKEFVYTSSSAVFGLVDLLPVKIDSTPAPIEEYGKAKLEGELLCKEYFNSKMQIKIVRPRTILGAGRMGIFGLLFKWIENGIDIFLLGSGSGAYQFVSARDLACGIVRSVALPGDRIFNLGALEYGSFREDLSNLCTHARSGSKVRALPEEPIRTILKALAKVRLLPFAPYQLLLYGKPMYFDSHHDWEALGYQPMDSNIDCLEQGFDWYKTHKSVRTDASRLSVHKIGVRGKGLSVIFYLLKVLKRITK